MASPKGLGRSPSPPLSSIQPPPPPIPPMHVSKIFLVKSLNPETSWGYASELTSNVITEITKLQKIFIVA